MHPAISDRICRLAIIFMTLELVVNAFDLCSVQKETNQEKDELESFLPGDIDLSPLNEAVLVFGKSFAGKTTLVQLLAGTNTKIIATEQGQLTILTDWETTELGYDIPVLVTDSKTNISYYDLPSFGPKFVENDISSTFFTNKVARSIIKVKLVFVVEHSSLKSVDGSFEFLELLRHISEFVKDISKYKESMLLVVTKVENTLKEGKLVEDETVIESITSFLREFRNDLIEKKVVAHKDVKLKLQFDRSMKLVDIFLTAGKITLFRAPSKSGLLSEDEILQKGKINILNSIGNLAFSEISEKDFGFTLSPESNTIVIQLLEFVDSKNKNNFVQIFKSWKDQRELYFKSGRDWKEFINKLSLDITVIEKVEKELRLATSAYDIARFIMLECFDIGINIPFAMLSNAFRFDGYSDFFHLVGNTAAGFNGDKFRNSSTDLSFFTESSIVWYEFMIKIQDFLESYNANAERGIEEFFKHPFIDLSFGFYADSGVTKNKFNAFLNGLVSLVEIEEDSNGNDLEEYDRESFYKNLEQVRKISITDRNLEEINELYYTILNGKGIIECNGNNLLMAGDYIVLRNAAIASACGDSQDITVFATSTVFIYDDIQIYEGKSLVIVAPKLVVLGKTEITMQGSHIWECSNEYQEHIGCWIPSYVERKLQSSSARHIEEYMTPRPSIPGGNAGTLLILAGSSGGSFKNLHITSKGGKGGFGDHGSDSKRLPSGRILPPGPAGVGGLGGLPGAISVYVLDNATEGCLANCDFIVGDTGETGEFGRFQNGRTWFIETVTNQTLPKPGKKNIDILKIIADYKAIAVTLMKPYNFDAIIKFWELIDNSFEIQKFAKTLDLAREFLSITSEPYGRWFSNKVASARYSLLIKKLETFSQTLVATRQVAQINCTRDAAELSSPTCSIKFNQTSDEKTNVDKRAIYTIYSAALKRIYSLGIVEDIIYNLPVVPDLTGEISCRFEGYSGKYEEFEIFSQGENTTLPKYELDIENKIPEIFGHLKSSVIKFMEDVNGKTIEIIKTIEQRDKHNLTTLKQQLADNLKLKQVASGISIFCNFFTLLEIGVGSIKSLVNKLKVELTFNPRASDLTEDIAKIGAEAVKQQQSLLTFRESLPDELDIRQLFKVLLGKLKNIPTGSEKYQTLKSKLEESIEAYWVVLNLKKSSAVKIEINDIIIQLDKLLDSENFDGQEGVNGAAINETKLFLKSVSNLLLEVRSIPLFALDMSYLEAEKESGWTLINDLKELNYLYFNMKKTVAKAIPQILMDLNSIVTLQNGDQIQFISEIIPFVEGWQFKDTLKTLRSELQGLVTAIKIKDCLFLNIIRLVSELDSSVTKVTRVQEKVVTIRRHQHFEDLIYGSTGPQTALEIPGELGELVSEIKKKVNSESSGRIFQARKSAFLQFLFPLGSLFANELDALDVAISTGSKLAVDIAFETLKKKRYTTETQYIVSTPQFGFYKGKYFNPVVKWRGEDIQEQIKNLLSGKDIYLEARIVDSYFGLDSLKLRDFNALLSLQSGDPSLIRQFNSTLEVFDIHLTHTGNSYFRFQEKYYIISSPPAKTKYSFKTKIVETPVIDNDAYNDLKYEFTFSPYTVWKLALTPAVEGINFDIFAPFLNNYVDIGLGGYGIIWVSALKRIDDVSNYYQEIHC